MATNRITKAYLRSLTNEGLKRLRWQYENANGINTMGPSRTWRHRLAMIMEEQGRRWGKA